MIPATLTRRHLALAALALAAVATTALGARAFVTVATGDVTGVYYRAGGGVCALVNAGRSDHQVRCTVSSSPGSVNNIDALRRGERAFGFAQADLVQQAYTATGAYADAEPFEGLRTVAALHPETVTVLAGPQSGVDAVQDLRGKRVNIGPEGSGERASMQPLMDALGWTGDDFASTAGLAPGDVVDALCDGDIEAAVMITGHPNTAVRQALACGARLVPAEGPAINRLVRDAPYYNTTVIPAEAYAGMSQGIATYGTAALLLSSTNAPRETVRAVTGAILDGLDEFRGWHDALGALDAAGMAGGTGAVEAPVHPGARGYYEDSDLL